MDNVFKQARELARQGARRFGGRASLYFACALRLTLADRAKARARAGRPVARVASWAGRTLDAVIGATHISITAIASCILHLLGRPGNGSAGVTGVTPPAIEHPIPLAPLPGRTLPQLGQ